MLGNDPKGRGIVAVLGAHSEGVGTRPQEKDQELYVLCDELIEAVHQKNPVEALAAFRAIFMALEQKPHEEAPHEYQGG